MPPDAIADRLGAEAMLVVRAVAQAVELARSLEGEVAAAVRSKGDASPVTSADLAVQALLAARLGRHWPADALVAEEDAAALRAAPDLAGRVVAAVQRIDPAIRLDDVLAWIDRGRGTPSGRFWTLDPIDGTKGLLRGDQYAIAVALIDGGAVQIAVLACPRLSLWPAAATPAAESGVGGMAAAVRGRGAWWLAPSGHEPMRLSVSSVGEPSRARVLHSLEAPHSDAGVLERVVTALGAVPRPRLMDSQAKHVVLAGGAAELLFRFPTSPGRHEAIWDHAAGALIVEEAGGRVTDLLGRPLDFTAGRYLSGNHGLVASNGALHEAALAAVGLAGGTSPPRWEHLPHDADIGVVGFGPTRAEAFRQAALALTAIVTDPERVKRVTTVEVDCHAVNDELLLVEWLNTLIYEMAVRSMLFADFTVAIDDGHLHATATGEPVDPERHEPAVEPKGATLTALQVAPDAGGWRAQCVVDV